MVILHVQHSLLEKAGKGVLRRQACQEKEYVYEEQEEQQQVQEQCVVEW